MRKPRKKTSNRCGLPVMLAALLLATTTWAQGQSTPKGPTVAQVVKALEAEASEFADTGKWRREHQEYHEINRHDLDPKQIVGFLSRRLHRTPAFDAYIKWQLLGYLGRTDRQKLTERELAKIQRALPDYVPTPLPDRRLMRIFKKFDGRSRDQIGARQQAVLDKAQQLYNQQIDEARKLNFPIEKYRSAVRELFPHKSAVRLQFLIDETAAVMRSGGNQYSAMSDLKDAARLASTAEQLSSRERKLLIGKIEKLKSLTGQTFQIRYDGKNNEYVCRIKEQRFHGNRLDHAQVYLRGQTPEGE